MRWYRLQSERLILGQGRWAHRCRACWATNTANTVSKLMASGAPEQLPTTSHTSRALQTRYLQDVPPAVPCSCHSPALPPQRPTPPPLQR